MTRRTLLLCALAVPGCASPEDVVEDGVTLSSADAEHGIVGRVADGGARIDFTSVFDDGELVARITNTGGRELWSYREPAADNVTPTVFIGGELYRPDLSTEPGFAELSPEDQRAVVAGLGFTPGIEERIADIAGSPEGPLVRRLAIELVALTPPELTAERRGLETAFQAIQEAFGPTETSMSTADFYWTPDTGYLVLSQHPRTYFHRNLAQTTPVARDDGHLVDDCFGHCGAGCGNTGAICGNGGSWSHQHSDESIGLFEYVEDMGCGWYRQSTWDRLKYWHSFNGDVSYGCIAHDWCCRNMFLGCGNPVCIGLMGAALDQCALTWKQTWSYWDIEWRQVSGYTYWYDGFGSC